MGPEIQAFVSHCLANFLPILDCLIPNFKLKYEDSENVKAERLNVVVFNLHQIKRRAFFFGTLGRISWFQFVSSYKLLKSYFGTCLNFLCWFIDE